MGAALAKMASATTAVVFQMHTGETGLIIISVKPAWSEATWRLVYNYKQCRLNRHTINKAHSTTIGMRMQIGYVKISQ